MIVISAGLQKSGSGLLFNLTNDLLISSGHDDIRVLREKYDLGSIVRDYNCNAGTLTDETLQRFLDLHDRGHSFIIKTHNGFPDSLRPLLDAGKIKVTCIYRDPRDVVISVMDHGNRIRENNPDHVFALCDSVETTVKRVKSWIANSIVQWLGLDEKHIIQIRYEDLISDPVREMKRAAGFLNIQTNEEQLKSIYMRYEPSALDHFKKDYLHFNKGIAGRYKTVFTDRELEYCNSEFRDYFTIPGYEV